VTQPAPPPAQSAQQTPPLAAEAPAEVPAPAAKAPVPLSGEKAKAKKEWSFRPLPLPVFFAIGLGLLLIAALVFLLPPLFRRLQSNPHRVMSYMAGRTVSHSRMVSRPEGETRLLPPLSQTETGHVALGDGIPMVYLFVDDQNTHIGRRNIHALKAGKTYTVGGGKSDFLIFLVPLPRRIGEFRFDGEKLDFVPRKSQYFPDLGSQVFPDCLGRTIRVISDKNYQLSFRILRYEDPLIPLNNLLMQSFRV
jgi:hypothetical protein